jgi:hypothetical protein
MDKQTYKQKIQVFFSHEDTKFILPMAVYHLGVIVFVGSLIMFGFGVAPVLFKVMPTKDLAGMGNQAILSRMVILQGAGLGLIAIALILLRSWSSVIVRKSLWFILCLITSLYAIYGIIIQNSMFSLQSAIGSFDNPTEIGMQALTQFRQLHKLYSFLSSFASLLTLASMIMLMYVNRKNSDITSAP